LGWLKNGIYRGQPTTRWHGTSIMNTITMLVTIFTLWLVMGLGFLSEYAQGRRRGASITDSMKSTPGILFFLTIIVSIVVIVIKISGP
jgi:hypothetical protein